MRIGSREVGTPTLLVVGLCLALLLTVGFGTSTSASTYGAFNTAWDGGSGIRDVAADAETESTVVYNTTEYDDVSAPETVAFVVSPERGYTTAEATRIESFVKSGGTLVVADDFRPNSNDLLARLGARARVNGTPLRDDRHQYKTGSLPIATRTASDPLARDVDQLTLNHPTTIEPNGATVLARSSNFSYLDRDGDATLDENETLRSYPVVSVERLGSGEVVVVGDPSLFINSMLERSDNRAFVEALVGQHESLLVDVSHVDERPPLQVALHAIRASPLLQLVFGAGGLSIVVALGRRRSGAS
ncbi:DUF4350 domain-containing protein [Haloferax namakaokahaiae]|uniref:DUF4350 domain-containing protein n=1 Tax=Haloferax namakaokahaiae TaxID=1748331 RepID=A0ABD5ZBU0_9EURY